MQHPFDRYAAFTDLPLLLEASFKPLRKSIRVNALKNSVEKVKEWGSAKGWEMTPVPWCIDGFFIDRVNREEALGKDLLHLLGHIYLQEAASMLPVEALDPQPGDTILDMSAAPGSKTTQIASKIGTSGLIVANDVQEKRLWTLKSAIHRSGVINNFITRKVGQWFAKNMSERFDRVLCDAPCTAQGTSRKDSDALEYCSPENIGKMAKLQRELLTAAVHACKVGGTVVYSTCTLTPEENEEVVLSILNDFKGQLEIVDPRTVPTLKNWDMQRAIDDSLKVQETIDVSKTIGPQPMIRLWPHAYDTEGFFCAILRKTTNTKEKLPFKPAGLQEDVLSEGRTREIVKLLEDRYGTTFMLEGEAMLQRGDQLILSTESAVHFKSPVQDYAIGIPFGRRLEGDASRIGHDVVTLRGQLATRNVIDLDQEQMDQLLDGKDTTCDPSLRSDIILRYKGMSIGLGVAKDGKLLNRLPRWVVQKS